MGKKERNKDKKNRKKEREKKIKQSQLSSLDMIQKKGSNISFSNKNKLLTFVLGLGALNSNEDKLAWIKYLW